MDVVVPPPRALANEIVRPGGESNSTGATGAYPRPGLIVEASQYLTARLDGFCGRVP
jgi:hypothetical protein